MTSPADARVPVDRCQLQLSRREQAGLMDAIVSLLDVSSADDFGAWSDGPLQTLLPHAMMVSGIADIRAQQIRLQRLVVRDWPTGYIEALSQPESGFYSPIVLRWNRTHAPQLYEPGDDDATTAQHRRWLDIFHDYGLRNIASHGVHDVASSSTSYFNFSGLARPLDGRVTGLLELLTPHMHLALTRALAQEPATPCDDEPTVALTARERDVLRWMLEGKTNWEIAQITHRSEHTIKHQVERVLAKLSATNRAQAVAKALAMGLVLSGLPTAY